MDEANIDPSRMPCYHLDLIARLMFDTYVDGWALGFGTKTVDFGPFLVPASFLPLPAPDYFMSKSHKRDKPREKRNRQSTTAPEEKDEEEEEPQRFVTYGAANSYGGAVTSYDDDEWGVGSGHVSKKID